MRSNAGSRSNTAPEGPWLSTASTPTRRAHTAMTYGSTNGFRAGDWVQVRSKAEILRTLDANGRLDELPFMPEMLQFCGKTLRIGKRAHKTCDPAVGIGGRKMSDTVHLENIRCNGSAHDGCEAGCLIFWKQAWLRPLDGATERAVSARPQEVQRKDRSQCAEEALYTSIKVPQANGETEP